MDCSHDATSDHLAEVRRHIMALRSSTGMTEEDVFKLLRVGDAQQQQQQQQPSIQQQQQQQQQQQPISPNGPGFLPHQHHPRFSISSTRSGSSVQSAQSVFSHISQQSADSVATRYSQVQIHQPPPPQSQPPPQAQQSPEKIYTCTSCEVGFKRKFDWKRHEEEFHERFKKYPCPDCNRVFWGSNSFNQHHKQAHGCKTCPHADAIVKYTKKRTAWGCGFCAAFLPSRERYFDHVAQHFDKEKKTKADWLHSNVIYALLHQKVIHDIWKAQKAQREREQPSRTEKLSWDPTKTGRAQGFMEGECPGQLQDHLEFFSGSKEDATAICKMAYDQADILFLSRPVSTGPINTSPRLAPIPDHALPRQVVLPVQWPAPHSYAHPNAMPVAANPNLNHRASIMSISIDRALPPLPADVDMNMGGMGISQPPPTVPPGVPSNVLAELDSNPILEAFSPGPPSLGDWQSFATTMVEDPASMTARSPSMMDFPNPQQYFQGPVWGSNMQ